MESRLIDIENTATILGINTKTIERFIETGYLRKHTAPNIDIALDASEVEVIFGVKIPDERLLVTAVQKLAQEITIAELDSNDAATTQEETSTHETQTSSAIEHWKPLFEFSERLVAKLEDEVASLRDENRWLRTRIEKLEEHTQRDQLLIMAKTQSLHQLIEHKQTPTNNEPSMFTKALEWFGVKKVNDAKTSTTF